MADICAEICAEMYAEICAEIGRLRELAPQNEHEARPLPATTIIFAEIYAEICAEITE